MCRKVFKSANYKQSGRENLQDIQYQSKVKVKGNLNLDNNS
jgi:hypothetical protein